MMYLFFLPVFWCGASIVSPSAAGSERLCRFPPPFLGVSVSEQIIVDYLAFVRSGDYMAWSERFNLSIPFSSQYLRTIEHSTSENEEEKELQEETR